MNDMIRVYLHFLKLGSKATGIYNAGFENLTIIELANKIKNYIDSKIDIEESNDPRSYRQNSDKLISTNFNPKFTVDDAIKELIELYNLKKLIDEDSFYNIRQMQKIEGIH